KGPDGRLAVIAQDLDCMIKNPLPKLTARLGILLPQLSQHFCTRFLAHFVVHVG
ncbi:MAG: hypothetical protein RLZ45_1962, partial [Verrucomicrobiota bacterium]